MARAGYGTRQGHELQCRGQAARAARSRGRGQPRRVRRCQATASLRRARAARARSRSVDELVEVVWSDEAPDGRGQARQKQVSRLRARVGDKLPVAGNQPATSLDIDRETIDCRRFETLLERARSERSSADPAAAAEQLAAALALWRGPALADHRFDVFAQGEIARLEELHLEAIEERLTVELARGQAADAAARRACGRHPVRERLRGSLCSRSIASTPGGRLEVMREARRYLVDQLGLEPGPSRAGRRAMILAHDPELDAEAPAGVLEATLPVPANATIGREREPTKIGALLVRPEVRLLTLVGAGGVARRGSRRRSARIPGRFRGGRRMPTSRASRRRDADARRCLRPRRRGRDCVLSSATARARDKRRRRARGSTASNVPRRCRPALPAPRSRRT